MRLRPIVAAVLLTLASAAQAEGVSTDPSLAPAGAYRVDKAHTRVIWQISHFGTSLYTGWFKTFDVAQKNAYAYEWLIECFQSKYDPAGPF